MSRAGSRKTDVYEALRRDILGGEFRPGAQLGFAALVERYQCSVGLVREALQRLTEQRLVESKANRGFRVVPVSPDDLRELTEARIEIETLALRMAIRDGDTEWEAQLVAAHHRMVSQDQFEPGTARFTEAWAKAHAEFHKALLAGCPNRRIVAMAGALRDGAELYWRWSAPLYDQDRDIDGEHRRILEASLARDAAAAEELLRDHISRTTIRLLDGVGAEPTSD